MATNRTTARQHNHGSVDGMIAVFGGNQGTSKCNFSATSGPTGSADGAAGYTYGSLWYDVSAKRIYICENPVNGAAVWKSLGTIAIGQLSTTGTAGTDTFLRGDGAWTSTLTSGISIGNALTFTGTGTVTGTSTQFVPTASGLFANVPATKVYRLHIGGTDIMEINSSVIYLPKTLTNNSTSEFNLRNIGNTNYTTLSGGAGLESAGATTYLYGNSNALAGRAAYYTGQVAGAGHYWYTDTASVNVMGLTSSALSLGTKIQMGSNNIEGGGTTSFLNLVNHNGSVSIFGDTFGGGLNGFVRYIHGAAVGAKHSFQNSGGTELFGINGTQLSSSVNIFRFTSSTGAVALNTSDTADNGTLTLTSTGDLTLNPTRGASIRLAGNENIDFSSLYPGSITFQLGNVSGAQYRFASKAGFSVAHYATIDENLLTVSSANGIYINGTAATIAAGTRQIGGTSGGIQINTPTGTGLVGSINNVQAYKVDANNSIYGLSAGTSLTTGTINTLIGGLAGNMVTTGTHLAAVGYSAMGRTGTNTSNYSVAFGSYALGAATTGSYSVSLGYTTLYSTDTGEELVCIGYEAGYNNTSGSYSTFIGSQAGKAVTTGSQLVAIGRQALGGSGVITGEQSVAIGNVALTANTSGSYNVATGQSAGGANTTGSYNSYYGYAAGGTGIVCDSVVAVGQAAGYNNKASENTFIGNTAGYSNSTGNGQVFVGSNAGYSNATSAENTFVGYLSGQLFAGTSGCNTYVGSNSGRVASTSSLNTFVGAYAGYTDSDSQKNVYMGYSAGYSGTTGNEKILLGYEANLSGSTQNYTIAIGSQALYNNTSGVNVAIGSAAGFTISTGDRNTAVGFVALAGGATPYSCVAIGYQAGYNLTGSQNVVIGDNACYGAVSSSGSSNTVIGHAACQNVSTGSNNTIAGQQAGQLITSGSGNMLFGYCAGKDITTGSYNLIMGHNIAADSATGDYQVNISNLLLRNTSGHITLNYGAIGSTLPMYSMTGQVTKQNVYGVTYANGSTTAILTLANTAGRIEFFDDQGERAVVRYDGTSAYLEQYSAEWGWTTTPAAGSIGLEVVGGVLNMYLGSSATRKIGWFIRNVSFA